LDTEPRLGEIRVATLVITGEVDVSAPVVRARAITGLIPGAVLHVVAGAPHMASLERPDLFNPPVLDFLRRVG
jgi:pimeloyl-ACP methyl ester carboxylesterase